MNQRIESIAVETLSFLRHNVLSRSDMEDIRIPDAFIEKFAQLIARECAEICYNNDYTDGTAYGDAIADHFGVE